MRYSHDPSIGTLSLSVVAYTQCHAHKQLVRRDYQRTRSEYA